MVKLDVKFAANRVQHHRLCHTSDTRYGLRQFPPFAFTHWVTLLFPLNSLLCLIRGSIASG